MSVEYLLWWIERLYVATMLWKMTSMSLQPSPKSTSRDIHRGIEGFPPPIIHLLKYCLIVIRQKAQRQEDYSVISQQNYTLLCHAT